MQHYIDIYIHCYLLSCRFALGLFSLIWGATTHPLCMLLLVLRSCCHPPSSSCFILRGWKHTFLQIGMNNSILVQYQVVQMHAIVTFIQVLICLWYNIVHWNFQNPIPNSNWNGRWGEDKVRELSQQSKVKKLPDKSCNTKAWTRGLSLLILPVQK